MVIDLADRRLDRILATETPAVVERFASRVWAAMSPEQRAAVTLDVGAHDLPACVVSDGADPVGPPS